MVSIYDDLGHELPPPISLSKRERNFLLRLLNENVNSGVDNEALINSLSNNRQLLTKRLNYILSAHPISHDMASAKKALIESIKSECISETNFNWIDTKNDRLCNYVWSYIRSQTQYPVVSISTMDIGISADNTIKKPHNTGQLFEQLRLDVSPSDNLSKRNFIISFIDMIDAPKEQKINDVEILKARWQVVSKKMDVKLWIEKCDTEWAWKYLFSNEKTGNKKPPVWFIDGDKSSTIKDCIVTLFDLLNELPSDRELIFRKMKAAWSQKHFRDKDNGKKSVNVSLPESIISMLDSICIKTDRRKNEVITRLIREEFEKIRNGGH